MKIWEIHTTENRPPFTPAEIEGMALSPDGRTLVTGGWNDSVQLWDLATLR